MKNITIIATSVILLYSACNSNKREGATSEDSAKVTTPSITSDNWTIDTEVSTIKWKGTKPTGFHEGTIQIRKGNLSTEDNKLTSGNFIIDMASIIETTNSDNPKSQNKLVNHLKSDDFFSVDSFPTAKFNITKVMGNIVYGNLTIKNITREVNFPTDIKIDGATLTASAKFDIERTDWNVNYNSGKKFKNLVAEKLIGDKIGYVVSLVAFKS